MEIEVSKTIQQKEFPSPSEDEESESSKAEDGELMETKSTNNNVCILGTQSPGAERLPHNQQQQLATFPDEGPSTSDGQKRSAELSKMLTIMQKLMMKKGLIDTSMTMDELEMLIEEEDSNECTKTNVGNTAVTPTPAAKQKELPKSSAVCNEKGKQINIVPKLASHSDVTIYKRAVQQIAPDLQEKIDKFVSDTCKSVEMSQRKQSLSSDEFMDISDDTANTNMLEFNIITEGIPTQERTDEQRADDLIRDAEKA